MRKKKVDPADLSEPHKPSMSLAQASSSQPRPQIVSWTPLLHSTAHAAPGKMLLQAWNTEGYRIPNTRYRIWSTEFDLQNLIYRIWSTEFDLQNLIYRIWNKGYRIQGYMIKYIPCTWLENKKKCEQENSMHNERYRRWKNDMSMSAWAL